MKKREQKWTTSWVDFLKYRAEGSHSLFDRSLLWEVKTGREGKPIPLSAVSLKQLLTLLKHKFIYKFSDISQFGTPCDGLYIPKQKKPLGVVVLSWETLGERDYAYIYPITLWNQILKTHPRKSMTLQQAKETAIIVRIT